jgi:hypothetical protein
MSIYRTTHCRIWDDDKFPFVSDDCQLVWFHLRTTPNTNPLGCYKATLEGLASEKRWPVKRYKKAIHEGLSNGFWKVDERFHVIYFPNHFKYNKPENPNVLRAWLKCLGHIPDCDLKAEMIESLKTFAEGWGEPFAKVTANVTPNLRRTVTVTVNSNSNSNIPAASPPRNLSETLPQTLPQTFEALPPCELGKKPNSHCIGCQENFERFWTTYPRHLPSRQEALKSFCRLKPDKAMVDAMCTYVQAMLNSGEWSDKKFIPHATRFLNARYWEGEKPAEPERTQYDMEL